MTEGGNDPIGSLLVTTKDNALAHFTTAGNDNLFVSKSLFHLPTQEQLEDFMRMEMDRLISN